MKENKQATLLWIRDVVVIAAVIFVVNLLLFKFVLSNDVVSGNSMQANFENGDRVISVRNLAIHRGDVVVLRPPTDPNVLYIKRVIGMPGDTIKVKDDVLYINGKKTPEPYLKEDKKLHSLGQLYTNNFSLESLHLGKKVPAGSYFVMGDHRNISNDSRRIGFIKKSDIVGTVKLRYWPLNKTTIY